jgi:RES domain-containing protein
MRVYRIQKAKYAGDISGFGSTLVVGRGHLASKSPILYTSSNISLAILEYVVHLTSSVKPPELLLLTLEVPDASIVTIDHAKLPDNWNEKGYYDNVQRVGTDWLEGLASLAIMIPSVTSADNNILVNPRHPDFGSVNIIDSRPITLDDRLI